MSDSMSIPIKAVADEKSIAQVTSRFNELMKKLRGMNVHWEKITKHATSITSEIQSISDASEVFAKKLSLATINSVKNLKDLSDKLENAHEKAAELAEAYNKADASELDDISKQMGIAAKAVESLTHEINKEKVAVSKQMKQVERLTKVQARYQSQLKEASQFDTGDIFEGIKSKISSGNLKGILSNTMGDIGKSIKGGISRRGLAKATAADVAAGGGKEGAKAAAVEMATAGRALAMAGVAMGAVAAGFIGLVALIKMASDRLPELNKALLDGVGLAKDMVGSGKEYAKTIDTFRKSAVNAHYSMLKFGKNSEDVLKVINSYAKESTGSLSQTAATMERLGSGSLDMGVNEFARNAFVYGQALAMEGTEIAAMMGQFQSEVGYGANNIQSLMGNIVKSAATANMPLTKFMGIFRQVIPDVDLFSNRLEQLTGVIKMLSKHMSPGMVKKFMDEFSKGLKGTSFQERIRMMFTAGGPGVVGNILKKDFEKSAKHLGAQFEDYGAGLGANFEEAAKGGEAKMAEFLAKAAKEASKQGRQLTGAQREAAMRLAFSESERAKGGPLHTATAMKGASTWGAYQIARKQSGFGGTKLGEGINEQVLENLGWSQAKIDLMKVMEQSALQYATELKQFGKTSSKSTNEELRKLIAIEKYGSASAENIAKVTHRDMQQADEDMVFRAAEMSSDLKDRDTQMLDLAVQQATATLSIGDKISNIIGFLLDKIYNEISFVVDLLNDIWSWITGGKDQQEMLKEIKNWRDPAVQEYEAAARAEEKRGAERLADEKDPEKRAKIEEETAKRVAKQYAMAEEMKMFSDSIEKSVSAGKTGKDLTKGLIDKDTILDNRQLVHGMLKEDSSLFQYYGKNYVTEDRSQNFSEIMSKFVTGAEMTSGEMDAIYDVLGSGDRPVSNIMTLGKGQIKKKDPSEEAKRRSEYKHATERPGSSTAEVFMSSAEQNAQKASDAEILEYLKPEDLDKQVAFKAHGESLPTKVAPKKTTPGGLAYTPGDYWGSSSDGSDLMSVGPVASVAPELSSESSVASSPTASAVETTSEATKKAAETGEIAVEKAETTVSLMEAVKVASESINTQVMGISMHMGDFKKFVKGPGIHLNKNKFQRESVTGALQPMLESVLDNKLTMFLYSLVPFMGDEGSEARKLFMENRKSFLENSATMSVLAGDTVQGVMENIRSGKDLDHAIIGHRDFGGDVPVSGMYRLQQGETVLRRGEDKGKSTTVMATINVSGAGDPKAVAIAVRNEIYNMSQRQ